MTNDELNADERPSGGVELSTTESWTLLRAARVGRLAVIIDGVPDIFPVNHLVDHGTLVFRTAIGTKLAGASGHQVAFEVDGYDQGTATAWSVVAKGEARHVNRLYDMLDAIELPLSPWYASPKPHFIRITPDTITGRRFKISVDASAGMT